jgi:hypothetical protein
MAHGLGVRIVAVAFRPPVDETGGIRSVFTDLPPSPVPSFCCGLCPRHDSPNVSPLRQLQIVELPTLLQITGLAWMRCCRRACACPVLNSMNLRFASASVIS